MVLTFVSQPQQSNIDATPPIRKLVGFERVCLNVGEMAQVFFPFSVDSLLTVVQNGTKWLEPGIHSVRIGNQVMHTVQLQGQAARLSYIVLDRDRLQLQSIYSFA